MLLQTYVPQFFAVVVSNTTNRNFAVFDGAFCLIERLTATGLWPHHTNLEGDQCHTMGTDFGFPPSES